jgi:hypothetical protein
LSGSDNSNILLSEVNNSLQTPAADSTSITHPRYGSYSRVFSLGDAVLRSESRSPSANVNRL